MSTGFTIMEPLTMLTSLFLLVTSGDLWSVVAAGTLKDVFPVNYPTFKKTGAVWMAAEHASKLPKIFIPANLMNQTIPPVFDSRSKWPKCTVINEIRNQGECACCWAHATAGALSDRLCITSPNLDFNVRLSAQDLLQCCDECATCGSGCKGGLVEFAYHQFVKSGIVSGGEFGQTGIAGGCSPFQYDPNFKDDVQDNVRQKVACTKQCSQSYVQGAKKLYDQDKYFGQGWYMITDVQPNSSFDIKKTERNMQLEIMTNGSVTANIDVYPDFYNYTKGVYNHKIDRKSVTGFHSLKVIGWGTESGLPYWLVANSWGKSWGERGFGKIFRGANITGIEARVSAGTPRKYQPNIPQKTSFLGGIMDAAVQVVQKVEAAAIKDFTAVVDRVCAAFKVSVSSFYSCDSSTGTEYRSSW